MGLRKMRLIDGVGSWPSPTTTRTLAARLHAACAPAGERAAGVAALVNASRGLRSSEPIVRVVLESEFCAQEEAPHTPLGAASGELDRPPDNATLNSLLQTLSATTMIEEEVIRDFIAGLATSGLDGGGVAADPESAARFQRGLLELLKGGSTMRVEHDAYVSFWMNCISKIGNPTLIVHGEETGAAAELLRALDPTPELAAYVKRRKNGEYETSAQTGFADVSFETTETRMLTLIPNIAPDFMDKV
ncbi:hypothetical protein T492DRAFT_853447 [Pavlovales sp. CCMP2436]|nr:hypothetical protein T492DRAFT_853447 [Pavlovales sp. CCMP2436]